VTPIACVLDIGINFRKFGIGKIDTMDNLKLYQIKPGVRLLLLFTQIYAESQSPSSITLILSRDVSLRWDIKVYIFEIYISLICGNVQN